MVTRDIYTGSLQLKDYAGSKKRLSWTSMWSPEIYTLVHCNLKIMLGLKKRLSWTSMWSPEDFESKEFTMYIV